MNEVFTVDRILIGGARDLHSAQLRVKINIPSQGKGHVVLDPPFSMCWHRKSLTSARFSRVDRVFKSSTVWLRHVREPLLSFILPNVIFPLMFIAGPKLWSYITRDDVVSREIPGNYGTRTAPCRLWRYWIYALNCKFALWSTFKRC